MKKILLLITLLVQVLTSSAQWKTFSTYEEVVKEMCTMKKKAVIVFDDLKYQQTFDERQVESLKKYFVLVHSKADPGCQLAKVHSATTGVTVTVLDTDGYLLMNKDPSSSSFRNVMKFKKNTGQGCHRSVAELPTVETVIKQDPEDLLGFEEIKEAPKLSRYNGGKSRDKKPEYKPVEQYYFSLQFGVFNKYADAANLLKLLETRKGDFIKSTCKSDLFIELRFNKTLKKDVWTVFAGQFTSEQHAVEAADTLNHELLESCDENCSKDHVVVKKIEKSNYQTSSY